MDMKRQTRKTDRRTINKIVEETVQKGEFKNRTVVNIENIRLLLADSDFQDWARGVRDEFGIPSEGFKPQSTKVRKWFQSLDNDLWFEKVSEIFIRYTKINEPFRVYVEKYIVYINDFQGSAIEPFETYRIGRAEIFFKKLSSFFGRKSQKLPQLVIDVFAPPTTEQWDRIISEVNSYFSEFDIPTGKQAFRPTSRIDLKVIALKSKQPIGSPENDTYPAVETDEVLIQSHYPKATKVEIKKMVRNLPQERKRAKVLLVKRLGKTDISTPNTKF